MKRARRSTNPPLSASEATSQLGQMLRQAWATEAEGAGFQYVDDHRRMFETSLFVKNLATGRPYGWYNLTILVKALKEADLLDRHVPALATFRQIRALGGTVRRGSRAVARVCSFVQNAGDDESGHDVRPRWSSVFHHTQCDGLPTEILDWLQSERRRQLCHYTRRARSVRSTQSDAWLPEKLIRGSKYTDAQLGAFVKKASRKVRRLRRENSAD